MLSKLNSALNYTFNYSQHLKEKFSEAFKSEDLKQIKLVMKEVEDHITKNKKNISEIISPKDLEGTLFLTLNKKNDSEEKAFIEQVLKLMKDLSSSDKENLKFKNLLEGLSTQELVSALTESDYCLTLRVYTRSQYDDTLNSIIKKNDLELLLSLNPKLNINKSIFLEESGREIKSVISEQCSFYHVNIHDDLVDIMLYIGADFITPYWEYLTPLNYFLAKSTSGLSTKLFPQIVKKVYEQGGKEAINSRNNSGFTVLMNIIYYNSHISQDYMPHVLSLIECGADVSTESVKNARSDGLGYQGNLVKFKKENAQVDAVINNRLILDSLIKNIADYPYFMTIGLPTDINNHIMSFLIDYDQIEHDVELQKSVRATSKHLFNSVRASGTIMPELVPFAKRKLIERLDKNLEDLKESSAVVSKPSP